MEEIGEEREIVEGNNQARQSSLKQHLIQTLEMQSMLTRPFVEIRDIKVGKEVWKLPVRIVNLWYAKDYLKHKHIEMVLMDLNCDRIQMVVPARYVRSFSSKLVEYQTIIVNNFKVKENDLLSRACPNPLKLVWFDGTFISDGSLPPIPEIRFFFKDFAEILGRNWHPDDIHDVIGVVHEVTFHQRNDSKLPLVMFVLRDSNQVLLDCLLWGSHATTFLAGVSHDVGVEPTTVILRNVVIHEAYEYSPISIGNGDYGTQVFTDQSITEIIDFKQSIPDPCPSIITIRIGNIDNPILVGNDQENLGLDGEIRTLQQLNQLSEEYECITVGTTNQIIVSRDGWTYEGCAWCSKNVFVSEGVLKCGNGHVNSIVTPRYKLEIEVIHQEERSVFVFSDSLCAHFFGISAFELKKSLLVEEQCHARFYPLVLDDILGLKMVAKVKWNPTFRSGYVRSYSTEHTLVELVESKVFINF
ncbi:replication protein A 70 kDa DNA-binding subunit B [Trifolium repens]|nr:replication protein A 70 kDa DNA-binding subunit B [Trifolium repens]